MNVRLLLLVCANVRSARIDYHVKSQIQKTRAQMRLRWFCMYILIVEYGTVILHGSHTLTEVKAPTLRFCLCCSLNVIQSNVRIKVGQDNF